MAIDMDNPNRMIVTGNWEKREHHSKYIEFRRSEGPEGVGAQIRANLSQELSISWLEVVYKAQYTKTFERFTFSN